MTRPIRAVIFDLDGTLLDTLADIARAMNTVLASHGLPGHEVEAYRWMVGSGLDALVSRAAPEDIRDDPRLIGRLAVELRDEYARHPVVETEPYAGVPELLGELQLRRLPLAVLSNKADTLVRDIVEKLFPEHPFQAVQGMRPNVPAKPHPESAITIAGSLGVNAATVLYLGDSDVDMQTALNAGMVPVGAGWGFRGPEELHAAGAHVVLDHPGALVQLIKERAEEWQR